MWPGIAFAPVIAMLDPWRPLWGFVALGVAGWFVLGVLWISLEATDFALWRGGARLQLGVVVTSLVTAEVTWFASLYWLMSRSDAVAFDHHLRRMDAMYFTLAIFTTTGFGDLHAASEGARAAVSAQMVLTVVTVLVIVTTAVQNAVSSRRP
jgi:hypothetical protein